MSKLRILFLPSWSWYPNERRPLDGTFVREHARAVALYDEVVVLFPDALPLRRLAPRVFLWQESDDDGLRTTRVRYPEVALPHVNWLLFVCASVWGFLRLRKTFRPDLIHAHVTLPGGLAGAVLSTVFRLPLVVTEHQCPFSERMRTWRSRGLARFVVSRSEAILPVSDSLRRDMEGLSLLGRYFVIPNSVDFTIFHPSTETANDDKRILVVAALEPRKGFGFLLDAVAQLLTHRRDFVVDIVGDGPDRQALSRMSAELSMGQFVHFYGLKTKEEVASFMQRCSFLVLPSLAETFGCVVAEALACGKPVVVTRSGGPEDFVGEKVGILVPPGDAEALAGAMDDMLNRYLGYDAKRLSAYAKERFSHESVGSAIDKVYQKVLS